MRFKLSLKSKKSKIITIIAASLAVVTLVGVLVPFASLRKEKAELLGSVIVDNGPVFIQPAYGIRNEDYAKLYEQEGLVACYMAYESSSITFAAKEVGDETVTRYSWRNYVAGGEAAEFDKIGVWRVMDGGFGYRVYYEDRKDASKYGALVLPDDYMTGNAGFTTFEVETVAKHLGLTDKDTNAVKNTDIAGAYFNNISSFRFGLLHCGSFLNTSDLVSYNRTNRWMFSWQRVSQNAGGDPELYDRVGVFSGWSTDLNAVTMHLTVADRTIDENQTVNLFYSYCGEFRTALDRCVVPFYTGLESDYLLGYNDSVSRFTLFNVYPGVVYSVRVYDRILDEEARLRNAFVDLLAFYEISANFFLELKESERLDKLNACAELADLRNIIMGNTDESAMSANRAKMYDIINEVFA